MEAQASHRGGLRQSSFMYINAILGRLNFPVARVVKNWESSTNPRLLMIYINQPTFLA